MGCLGVLLALTVGCGTVPQVSHMGTLGLTALAEESSPPAEPEGSPLLVRDGPVLEIGGFWVPALKVKEDEDETEPGSGIEFDADLNYGDGWGARVAVASRSNTSVGVIYLTTEHTERMADRSARTHQVYAEIFQRLEIDNDYLYPTAGVGFGLGAAAFDFRERFDDTGAAAGMVRAEIGITIARRLDLVVGGAGFLWGYPGETIGYGGFFTIGGTLRF